ncbi:hypothetical protein [Nostoc sp. MG11]|nr:hypothetical protein [Nostoc sp. MG11]
MKANLLKAFPTLIESENYLQVIIGRPVIILWQTYVIHETLAEQGT